MPLNSELASKVTATHLGRDAYVCVRQSTLTQVRHHTESLERQYELASRAQQLGWRPQQVVVVDADLGRSGADSSAREGFKGLVADVGLGKVGVILGIEVSRLARNNADWYQLLDLCAVTDTLIADGDGLYHPADFNDRLVLGLKGTMSEAELHLIRHRLTAGLKHKAAKGELRQGLPVGYVHDDTDHVVLDPDEAVQEAIATVFRRFDELGSARQVMLSMAGDNVLIPRRRSGARRVSWARASYPAIHDFLTNPCYAGAFVFGRTRTEKRMDENGQLVSRARVLPISEWEVLIPDHHFGFITWERFERTQQQLRANWRPPRGEGGGAAREGTALLQGLVRCGKCGRMMQVTYGGTTGNTPRYVCARSMVAYSNERACQSIGGRRLDNRVLTEILSVLEPANMEATAKALAEAESNYRQSLAIFELAVERAHYEAERAHKQYDAVEPENRLVARTLERALESALIAERQAEAELSARRLRRPTCLTEEEATWLSRVGSDLKAVFEAPTTTWRQRKQLARAVVREVVVTVREPCSLADVSMIFEGGTRVELPININKKGKHFHTTSEDTVDLVRRLAERYDDKTIASILSKQGRRTGTGLPFTKTRVASLRWSRGIEGYKPPPAVTPSEHDAEVVTLSKAAPMLGVARQTLYRWLEEGLVAGEQLTPHGPWHIRLTDEIRRWVVPDVPPGWLSLNEAAAALGVARQTVLHKVQRGELEAGYVNHGKRRGLRINVTPAGLGPFITAD